MLRHIFAPLAAGAVAVAVLSLAPGRSYAYEYVTNGSFEAGAASWATSGGTIASIAVPDAVDGSHVGRLTIATDASSAIAQATSTPTAPAGTYTLSLSLRGAAGAGPVTVTLLLRAGSRQRVVTTVVDSTVWQTQQLTVTGPASANLVASVTVAGSGGDTVDIDAVSISGIDPNSVTATPTDVPPSPAAATPTVTRTPTDTATPTKTATPVTYVGVLRNAGFETAGADGSLLAWDHYGGSMSVATHPVHTGAQSARLESDSDSTKWLYQPVAVDPDATYAFGAWVYDDDPAVASAFLRVSWYASADASGSALDSIDSTMRIEAADAQFRSLTTGSIAAPQDAHSARLRVILAPVSSAPAVIYVDDASFGPAAPATFTPNASATVATGGGSHSNTSAVLDAANRNFQTNGPHRTLPAALRSGQSRVLISEVFYDSAASGSDADNEWVELYNAGDVDQNVGGWTLADNAASDTLPPLVVPARGYAIVAASDSFSDAYPGYAGGLAVLGNRIGNSLGNDGDRLALKDGAGNIADAISWGNDASILDPSIPDVPAGHSIERRTPGGDTDTAADFTDNLNPSPGLPFAPAADRTAKPQQQPSTSGVPIIVGSDASFRTVFLWLALGSASTLVAGAAAWRFAPVIRRRLAR
ncbi:MAG TPA: lamin tail domain-containing protein [Dehalococcoidia bacterium]|nr:lamin tail domain-containing protein [Dehalococcoidia bacterium]